MRRWWPGAHGLQNLAKILKTRTHTCPHWTALVPLRFGSLQHVLLCFCEWPEKHANENNVTKIQQRLWVKGCCTWECFGYNTEPSTSMPDCQSVDAMQSTGPRHQEKGHVSGKERIQAISGSPAMSALNKNGYWKSSSIMKNMQKKRIFLLYHWIYIDILISNQSLILCNYIIFHDLALRILGRQCCRV